VRPQITYLLTRRCSERRFFLLPEPAVTWIFEYLLGLLSKQYGMQIHAYVVMSNHYHIVLTDTQGCLPDFQRDLNSLLARAVNRHWRRREAFWARESYSAVELLEDEDVVSKMAYTLANPVKARLVNRACEWEGATSAGMVFGRARLIAKPEKFFRDSMPDVVELVLTRPAGFERLSNAEVLELVRVDVARREAKHREGGSKVARMTAVRKQKWWERPESEEPWRQLKPTVAGRNKWARIEALRRSKEWLGAYYDALRRFVGGERDVEFPCGTWQMCARLQCPVAGA
jgi:putative transposase